jgi:catechol 2,3-dioxygenase-like lactoylglutathione lyase family enzyme
MKKSLIALLALLPALAGAAEPTRPAITAVSHVALYAADPAASEHFYVHDLGAVRGEDPENPKGVRYYFSPRQFVEILPLPSWGAASAGRLDHIAFTVADAKEMRSYLAARHWKVPGSVSEGSDGSAWFTVEDPEGHRIEFAQAPPKLPAVPDNPLSAHIIHGGFIIQNRAREDSFYRDILGFRPYWFGGMKEDQASWISQQLPDGPDWLEYMLVAPGDKVDRRLAGILDHLALGIANVETAYTQLWTGDRLSGQEELPKIGRDAKWQLNLYDPDGTRVELMELHAIGTPCCSPFTAADPEK